MKKKRKSSPKNINEHSVLDDFGLEPPKRYRSPGNNSEKNRQNSAGDINSISRHEKRYRETKKRKKKNKLRKTLIWTAVVLTLSAMGVILSFTVFFHIENIIVKGNGRYSSDEIILQSNIDKGKNMLAADTEGAKKAIERNLPYIYEANIKRKLPTTIEISVKEASAAYSIENKSKTFVLLDDKFKVLETDSKKSYGMIIKKAEIGDAVAGTKIKLKDSGVQSSLEAMSSVIKEKAFTEFTALYSNGVNDNYLVYNGRIEFKLGNTNNLEDKIYKGLAACEKLDKDNPNAKGVMTIANGKQIYFTEK